jgi:hypothetical protein
VSAAHDRRVTKRVLGAISLALLLLAACSAASAPGGAGGTQPASASPASATTAPSKGGPVDSIEEAAARVIASNPLFKDVRAKDPNLIGQCCWWEGAASDNGWELKIVVGWGDCPAGCIHRHQWRYAVAHDGSITPLGDSGDPIPPGGIPKG